MQTNPYSDQNNVILKLPVNISYQALVTYTREKFRGEIIKVEKDNGKSTNYAEILDVSFERSLEENYDLVFDIRFKTLTTIFRNKEGRILLHAAIDFNEELQVVTVTGYKLNSVSNSWLMDNSLEAMANKLIYSKLKKKMNFNFTPIIEKQLKEINEKIASTEVKDGISLFGKLEDFKITALIPKLEHLLVVLDVKGNAVVDIDNFDFAPSKDPSGEDIV